MPPPQQLVSTAGLRATFGLLVVLSLPLSAPSTAAPPPWAAWSLGEVCPSAKAWVTHPGSFCTTLWHSPYLSNRTELEGRERRAINAYCEVDRILERFDCSQEYSVNVQRGQCKLCRQAYREWACAMVTDTLEDGQLDCSTKLMPCPSCASICHQVMRLCPYLSPDRMQFDLYGQSIPQVSQYGGHPAFYCPLENDDPSDPAYTSLCFNSYANNDPDYVHNICTNGQPQPIGRRRRHPSSSSSPVYDHEDEYIDYYTTGQRHRHYTSCCWTYASSVVTFVTAQTFPRYGSDAFFNATAAIKPSNYSDNRVILNCCDHHGSCTTPEGGGEASEPTHKSELLLIRADSPSSSLANSGGVAAASPPLFKTRKRSSEAQQFPPFEEEEGEGEDERTISIDTEDKTIQARLSDDSSSSQEATDSFFKPEPTTHIVVGDVDSYDEHYVDTEPDEGGSTEEAAEFDKLLLDEEPGAVGVESASFLFSYFPPKTRTTTTTGKSTPTVTATPTTPTTPPHANNNEGAGGGRSVHYQKNAFMAIVIGEGDGVDRHHPNLGQRTRKGAATNQKSIISDKRESADNDANANDERVLVNGERLRQSGESGRVLSLTLPRSGRSSSSTSYYARPHYSSYSSSSSSSSSRISPPKCLRLPRTYLISVFTLLDPNARSTSLLFIFIIPLIFWSTFHFLSRTTTTTTTSTNCSSNSSNFYSLVVTTKGGGKRKQDQKQISGERTPVSGTTSGSGGSRKSGGESSDHQRHSRKECRPPKPHQLQSPQNNRLGLLKYYYCGCKFKCKCKFLRFRLNSTGYFRSRRKWKWRSRFFRRLRVRSRLSLSYARKNHLLDNHKIHNLLLPPFSSRGGSHVQDDGKNNSSPDNSAFTVQSSRLDPSSTISIMKHNYYSISIDKFFGNEFWKFPLLHQDHLLVLEQLFQHEFTEGGSKLKTKSDDNKCSCRANLLLTTFHRDTKRTLRTTTNFEIFRFREFRQFRHFVVFGGGEKNVHSYYSADGRMRRRRERNNVDHHYHYDQQPDNYNTFSSNWIPILILMFRPPPPRDSNQPLELQITVLPSSVFPITFTFQQTRTTHQPSKSTLLRFKPPCTNCSFGGGKQVVIKTFMVFKRLKGDAASNSNSISNATYYAKTSGESISSLVRTSITIITVNNKLMVQLKFIMVDMNMMKKRLKNCISCHTLLINPPLFVNVYSNILCITSKQKLRDSFTTIIITTSTNSTKFIILVIIIITEKGLITSKQSLEASLSVLPVSHVLLLLILSLLSKRKTKGERKGLLLNLNSSISIISRASRKTFCPILIIGSIKLKLLSAMYSSKAVGVPVGVVVMMILRRIESEFLGCDFRRLKTIRRERNEGQSKYYSTISVTYYNLGVCKRWGSREREEKEKSLLCREIMILKIFKVWARGTLKILGGLIPIIPILISKLLVCIRRDCDAIILKLRTTQLRKMKKEEGALSRSGSDYSLKTTHPSLILIRILLRVNVKLLLIITIHL